MADSKGDFVILDLLTYTLKKKKGLETDDKYSYFQVKCFLNIFE